MKSKSAIIFILLAFVSMSFGGCNLLKKRVEKKEKVSFTLGGQNKTKITVDNTNGEIKLSKRTDTLAVIQINAEKTAKVKYDEQDKPLDNVKINIDSTANEISISTEEPRVIFGLFNKGGKSKVNFEIKVPANMNVEVNNVNGTISLSGINGNINAETVNGMIALSRCTGEITLTSTNGQVSGNLDSVKSLNVDVVNGRINLGGLRNISAQVNASTVNGKVKFSDLTFSNLSSDKRNLTGTLGTGKSTVKLNAINGSITLNANDIALEKKHEGDFEFKFDFNDDDNNMQRIDKKLKDTEKKLKDTEKTLQESKPADTNKAR